MAVNIRQAQADNINFVLRVRWKSKTSIIPAEARI
jgi:hypothetical protein